MKKYSDYFYKQNAENYETGATLNPEAEEPLTQEEVLGSAVETYADANDSERVDANADAAAFQEEPSQDPNPVSEAPVTVPETETQSIYAPQPEAVTQPIYAPQPEAVTQSIYAPQPQAATQPIYSAYPTAPGMLGADMYNSRSSLMGGASSFSTATPETPDSTNEKTIISKNAVIHGELTVNGDIQLQGRVKGNVTSTGNMEISGKVIGNITGNDIDLNGCEIKGDIEASGYVLMDKESVMVGNLSAQEVTIDGKIKGDLTVAKKIHVRKNSLIVGNVKANSLAIEEGAALQGQIAISTGSGESLDVADPE